MKYLRFNFSLVVKLISLSIIVFLVVGIIVYASVTSVISMIIKNPLIPKNVGTSLSDMAGYRGERLYLVLFADSNEPRPVCGFTGWYAIVKLKNGNLTIPEIVPGTRAIGKTYDLDEMLAGKDLRLAPMPANIFSKWWYLRDSINWPDFPYTASWTKKFYDLEVNSGLPWTGKSPWPGSLKKIDGVVVISSEMCKEFLRETGPIEIKTVESSGSKYDFNAKFTRDNFDFLINFYSNRFNQLSGFPGYEFIYALMNEMYDEAFARFNTTNSTKQLQMVNFLLKMLNRKHIVIYSTKPEEEKALKFLGWAGEIKSSVGDYLGVFDSHGSYSTRLYTSRTVAYSITPKKDGSATGRAEVTYYNAGKVPLEDPRTDWFNYRTFDSYVTTYVPKGAKYLRSSYVKSSLFIDTDALDQKPSYSHKGPHMGRLFNRTFFAGWIRVLPKRVGKIWFEYGLPKGTIKAKGSNQIYRLFFQKQPGVRNEEFWFTFVKPKNCKIIGTSVKPFGDSSKALVFKLSSELDKSLWVEFK